MSEQNMYGPGNDNYGRDKKLPQTKLIKAAKRGQDFGAGNADTVKYDCIEDMIAAEFPRPEQTKLSVEEAELLDLITQQSELLSIASHKWYEIYRKGKGMPSFDDGFLAGHTHAISSSNMVELDRVITLLTNRIDEVLAMGVSKFESDTLTNEIEYLITEIKNIKQ